MELLQQQQQQPILHIFSAFSLFLIIFVFFFNLPWHVCIGSSTFVAYVHLSTLCLRLSSSLSFFSLGSVKKVNEVVWDFLLILYLVFFPLLVLQGAIVGCGVAIFC